MNSFAEFILMGGYAFYVWTAYEIAFIVLLVNLIMPVVQRKQFLRELALKQKRIRQ